jgi:hypothetical protein
MGLSLLLLWIYAGRHRFLSPGIPQAVVRDIRLNLLLPSLVFVASVITAAFNATLAMTLWFLLIPVYIFRRHTESAFKNDELL